MSDKFKSLALIVILSMMFFVQPLFSVAFLENAVDVKAPYDSSNPLFEWGFNTSDTVPLVNSVEFAPKNIGLRFYQNGIPKNDTDIQHLDKMVIYISFSFPVGPNITDNSPEETDKIIIENIQGDEDERGGIGNHRTSWNNQSDGIQWVRISEVSYSIGNETLERFTYDQASSFHKIMSDNIPPGSYVIPSEDEGRSGIVVGLNFPNILNVKLHPKHLGVRIFGLDAPIDLYIYVFKNDDQLLRWGRFKRKEKILNIIYDYTVAHIPDIYVSNRDGYNPTLEIVATYEGDTAEYTHTVQLNDIDDGDDRTPIDALKTQFFYHKQQSFWD